MTKIGMLVIAVIAVLGWIKANLDFIGALLKVGSDSQGPNLGRRLLGALLITLLTTTALVGAYLFIAWADAPPIPSRIELKQKSCTNLDLGSTLLDYPRCLEEAYLDTGGRCRYPDWWGGTGLSRDDERQFFCAGLMTRYEKDPAR